MSIPFLFQFISSLQFVASGAQEKLSWINWGGVGGAEITGKEIIQKWGTGEKHDPIGLMRKGGGDGRLHSDDTWGSVEGK